MNETGDQIHAEEDMPILMNVIAILIYFKFQIQEIFPWDLKSDE